MQDPSIDAVIKQLERLLFNERDLLMRGEVRAAVALADEKLAALGSLESALSAAKATGSLPIEIRSIERVKAMAAQNAIHFEAVRNGLSGLATRLEEMNGGQSVGAYDQNGEKVPFSGAIGRYNKRV